MSAAGFFVYPKKRVRRKFLKDGFRLDEGTGKIYRTVIPSKEQVDTAVKNEFSKDLPDWIKARIPTN